MVYQHLLCSPGVLRRVDNAGLEVGEHRSCFVSSLSRVAVPGRLRDARYLGRLLIADVWGFKAMEETKFLPLEAKP